MEKGSENQKEQFINLVSSTQEKIKSIKFFLPERSLEESNSLISKTNELIDKYCRTLVKYRTSEDNESLEEISYRLFVESKLIINRHEFPVKWEKIWDTAWNCANTYARSYGDYGIHQGENDIPRDCARDAARYFSSYVAFEAAKEKLGYPHGKGDYYVSDQESNPFKHVISMYELGLKPTFFRSLGQKEVFVIDIPLKTDTGSSILGCYAHGDPQILFNHKWSDYCKELTPINDEISNNYGTRRLK